jgi:hypothetical protein
LEKRHPELDIQESLARPNAGVVRLKRYAACMAGLDFEVDRSLHSKFAAQHALRRDASDFPFVELPYCWKTGAGPLTRFHFRDTFTSTRLAILMKGIFLFIP